MRFLLTIATGVFIGILIAPDKGSKTRKKIADAIKDWSDKLSDITSESDQNEEMVIEESTVIVTQ